MKIEQHKWSEYTNFNHALFRILLGQCDEATKCEVKQHPDYKSANRHCCSIELLSVIRKVARSGSYGTKSNPVYRIMNEHWRYTSYRQQNNKNSTDLTKDMTANYDTLISQSVELPFGMKIMEDLIEANKKDAAWLDDLMEYMFLDAAKKAVCHKAYKQATVARMLVMSSNDDRVQKDLEHHIKMTSSNNSPYPDTIASATAHLLFYETTKRTKGNRRGAQNNDDPSNTEEQGEGKTFLAVGVSPKNDVGSDDNNFEQDSADTQQEEVDAKAKSEPELNSEDPLEFKVPTNEKNVGFTFANTGDEFQISSA